MAYAQGAADVYEDASWALEPLLVLPGVEHGLVVTSDGMVWGASSSLSREAAECASAMMSALRGAARALASALSGDPDALVRQIVVETGRGYVFALPAGHHSVLALSTSREVDMGSVTYAMQCQVALLAGTLLRRQATGGAEA
ncbi:roadblock/LC7 domain-containing protein [Streptacidiphilus sp. PB12-B1b]|uniref:roadblock/LC7 domain-containing protein n=1 Tax=Streptacidiphilus sp. PB12-B1b TaxID=2705012 RepID=UPI0015F87A9E|nr:roadblock/LC7 domain-containing protein [Streptacidiphilus sp. PB12-B1b]QMU76154.1 roadblock/LC7 domain-containing protein [Streptacidiphilus sp. PB12-B1b]